MKLFLATNSLTTKTDNIKMLEVACKSAVQNTNFDIYVIFDGKKEELNLPKEVTIIEHRHRCYDTFLNSKKNKQHDCMAIASGTFLRTEIPFICQEHGFTDEYVLYTDYDVLFQKGDYSSLNELKPSCFAAAPESSPDNWNYINAGIMLINVQHFLEEDDYIIKYIDNNFDNLHVWDQTLYNNLYSGRISKLPLEYNWKTYWGINQNAKIIHFHGAKPLTVEPLWRYDMPEIANIRAMNPKGYSYYSDMWDNYL
jgi:lipopolysaccharide biosynthesis glycosyltransferase